MWMNVRKTRASTLGLVTTHKDLTLAHAQYNGKEKIVKMMLMNALVTHVRIPARVLTQMGPIIAHVLQNGGDKTVQKRTGARTNLVKTQPRALVSVFLINARARRDGMV
jgi:hypothetical protein